MGDAVFGIDMNWSKSKEGKDEISKLRKKYGLLQPPVQLHKSNAYTSYSHKIMLYGKAAVGKTTLVSLLTNSPVPHIYSPTSGLTISTCYWPVKMMSSGGSLAIFKLDLWDVGSNALHSNPNFIDECKKGLDGIIYVFSFKDKSSFLDIVKKVLMDESITRIIIGNKFDTTDCDITMEEVKDIERRTKVKVMMVPENDKSTDFSHILNYTCSQLFSNKKISMDDVKTKYKL